MSVLAACLGFPRIGGARELKRALESYWRQELSEAALYEVARELRRRNWSLMKAAGLDRIPCHDFSLYDHVLDMAVLVGAIPARYRAITDPLTRYFAMARGLPDLPPLEMTKWFDTNYHYLVPELDTVPSFHLDATKLLADIDEARACGIESRPVLVGPVTFLALGRHSASPFARLEALLAVYADLLAILADQQVEWVQLDEPGLVLDLDDDTSEAYRLALGRVSELKHRPRLLWGTYFGELGDNLSLIKASACDGLHVDLVRAPGQLERVLSCLPSSAVLSLGVVDGRNVWRTDLDAAHSLVRRAARAIGAERIEVAPSCSLLHVPLDLDLESQLDPEIRGWLAFAVQKLGEVRALADLGGSDRPSGSVFDLARASRASRRTSPHTRRADVRARIATLDSTQLQRMPAFPERRARQRARLGLPPLPTTTIGSFPQTAELRQVRAAWRAGRIPDAEYQARLASEIDRCIEMQQTLGLDVLVHGEFERTDMVEYFAERLVGFAVTQHGWVQSYGSRCVRPPVLFGDVARSRPLAVQWSRYAQSRTRRPVKGVLTGPVTMLEWSYVRDDQSRSETCRQIALALRDEVTELEAAGIPIVQVDEPALRQGLPLRQRDRAAYLRWAVEAFWLATSSVGAETQIHTHMCYAEFGDILDAIVAMDADVLSIETARSGMALLAAFGRFRYPNEIGPGVYDVHAERVPTAEEMVARLEQAASVLPWDRLWANPDCGLKTRRWAEVEAVLAHLVAAARLIRERRLGGARPG